MKKVLFDEILKEMPNKKALMAFNRAREKERNKGIVEKIRALYKR